jgi:hypothetical protein
MQWVGGEQDGWVQDPDGVKYSNGRTEGDHIGSRLQAELRG